MPLMYQENSLPDELVPGLPPQSGQVRPPQGPGLQHGLRSGRRTIPASASAWSRNTKSRDPNSSPAARPATDKAVLWIFPPSDRVWPGPTAACYWRSLGELADTAAVPRIPAPGVPRAGLAVERSAGTPAVPEADERVARPGGRQRLHQAARREDHPLRPPARGSRPGPSAVLRDRDPVRRRRGAGPRGKPRGSSDQSRRESAASGQPGRHRHLHPGRRS